MEKGFDCEVVASEDAIDLLVRALEKHLREDGFGHIKIGLSEEGPGVSEYVRGQDVIGTYTHSDQRGLRLVVESETLDVSRIVQEAMARAAADLFHELVSGLSRGSSGISPKEVRAELLRLLADSAS